VSDNKVIVDTQITPRYDADHSTWLGMIAEFGAMNDPARHYGRRRR